jgi:CBS domain-containing protein
MTIEEVKKFLRKIEPFSKLDSRILTKIAGSIIIELYPNDSIILQEENSPCEYLQIIRKGSVKVSLRNGKKDNVEIRGAGNSFGCFRDKAGSNIRVSAVEDTTCYLVSKEVLHKILEVHPSISEFFHFKGSEKSKKKGG